jgi:hypothetical protein
MAEDAVAERRFNVIKYTFDWQHLRAPVKQRMISIRNFSSRALTCGLRRRRASFQVFSSSPFPTRTISRSFPFKSHISSFLSYTPQPRSYSSRSRADEIIEEIQEQYATARDEFEIATEETEKRSVYAADDRAAAREELDHLKQMYEKALESGDAEEVKRRVGQKIRELDNAIAALEESSMEE